MKIFILEAEEVYWDCKIIHNARKWSKSNSFKSRLFCEDCDGAHFKDDDNSIIPKVSWYKRYISYMLYRMEQDIFILINNWDKWFFIASKKHLKKWDQFHDLFNILKNLNSHNVEILKKKVIIMNIINERWVEKLIDFNIKKITKLISKNKIKEKTKRKIQKHLDHINKLITFNTTKYPNIKLDSDISNKECDYILKILNN